MSKQQSDAPSAPIDATKLGGIQYQALVFERLVDLVFQDRKSIKIEIANQDLGPVDYVVCEAAGTGALSKSRRHYFECKNYSRKLELDSVAKIMVVAVAEQPDSVHVVSRTRLQPQVINYASRIFSTTDKSDPIFRSISFHHWLTDDVLDLHLSDLNSENSHAQTEAEEEHPIAWWMTECGAFSELEIASSAIPTDRQLWVRHGSLLQFTMELPKAEAASICLLGLPDGSWGLPRLSEGIPPAATSYTFLIDTTLLDLDTYYRVSVQIRAGVVDRRLPIGEIRLSGSNTMLPEFRHSEIDDLVLALGGTSHGQKLVLIDGEAGVGKTHLIERVAESLRAKYGVDVLCFTVTVEFQQTLLATLLRTCLTPAMHRASFGELATAIQNALIQDEFDVQAAATDVAQLVHLAVRMGPRLLVIRGCELLSEAVANQLWALVVALNDVGWGGVKLILEYRQPEAGLNEAFNSLAQNIDLKMHGIVLKKTVLPLTNEQLSAVSTRIFPYVTPEIVKCLAQRTGGLPLFLESYLRRLLGLGFLKRESGAGAKYSIVQPARLLADEIPENGALLLEQRIHSWLQRSFADKGPQVARALGLLAVADLLSSQPIMKEVLHLPSQRLNAMCIALEAGGLGSIDQDGNVAFRHDLVRTAMISVATSCEGFAEFASRVAEGLKAQLTMGNELSVRTLRIRIFTLLGNRTAATIELRRAIRVADEANDYGRLTSFLTHLLAILPPEPDGGERLLLMYGLAWASWESDSLHVARRQYLLLVEEAEQISTGNFDFAEEIATNALRRAIGIDLELMEPLVFLKNAIAVLKRRQTLVTFNSIMNRLVLFCAWFGYPEAGYHFAEIAFNYIGNGRRENEGAVICAELGALYAPAKPEVALLLFRRGLEVACDESQRLYNTLDILTLESLHQGTELDLRTFSALWNSATKNRITELLTRASLLRTSLFLRSGDLVNARRWITRTSTMVNLYHRRQFLLPVLNDLLLAALLEGDLEMAKGHLAKLDDEFRNLIEQWSVITPWVAIAMEACRKAAEKLEIERSHLDLPEAPPPFCGVFSRIWDNISTLAPRLGMAELAMRYSSSPSWLQPRQPVTNKHLTIEYDGLELAVGAY